MRSVSKIIISVIGLLVFCLMGCDIDRNNPGYEYFEDMTRSDAYESYTPNKNFPDAKTNQWLPEGVIPIQGAPPKFVKTEEDRVKAGNDLLNPFTNHHEAQVKGKELYQVYCEMCHGVEMDGKGHLYTSKKYPYPPASLVTEKVQQEPDGSTFHAIAAGYGVMGAHGPLLLSDDIWRIVTYIKSDLHSTALK